MKIGRVVNFGMGNSIIQIFINYSYMMTCCHFGINRGHRNMSGIPNNLRNMPNLLGIVPNAPIISTNSHFFSWLFLITMSGLLCLPFFPVWISRTHSISIFPSAVVVVFSGTWSKHFSLHAIPYFRHSSFSYY